MPSDIGTVSWFGLANTHLSPFIPHYFRSEGLPKAFEIGNIAEYNPNSAWWMFQEVGQLSYRNYKKNAKELFKTSIRQYTHAQASLGLEKARELSQEIKSRFLANTHIDF